MRLSELYLSRAQSLLVECFNYILEAELISEAKRWWPQEWSDRLFCPEREFKQRSTARIFLGFLISNGVNAQAYLDQINSGSYPLEHDPPTAKGGGVGIAYIIGDKVVKITPDRKEAIIANALVGKTVPNLTKIHAVGELSSVGSRPSTGEAVSLYVIINDLVPDRIPGKYRIAANAVYNYLDRHNKPIENIEQAADEILSTATMLPSKYRTDPDIRQGIIKVLEATDAVYKATGILLQDPHGGNVMMRGRSIEFFDLGRSMGTPSNSQIARIT